MNERGDANDGKVAKPEEPFEEEEIVVEEEESGEDETIDPAYVKELLNPEDFFA